MYHSVNTVLEIRLLTYLFNYPLSYLQVYGTSDTYRQTSYFWSPCVIYGVNIRNTGTEYDDNEKRPDVCIPESSRFWPSGLEISLLTCRGI